MEGDDADGTERMGDRVHVSVAHEQPKPLCLRCFSPAFASTIHVCQRVFMSSLRRNFASTRIGCVCKLFIILVTPNFLNTIHSGETP